MERYRIEFRTSAFRELENIPRRDDRRRLVRVIEGLADNPRPRGCRKLSGLSRYRLRCGVFRIVYSIEDDRLVVYVVKIGHRRDVYRKE